MDIYKLLVVLTDYVVIVLNMDIYKLLVVLTDYVVIVQTPTLPPICIP